MASQAVAGMGDHEKLVCLGMDAFRVCLGLPTRNFTPTEVARIISNLARDRARRKEPANG